MADISKIKQVLNKIEFTEGVKQEIGDILTTVEQNGGNFTNEQLDKIIDLIENDILSHKIEANIFEEVALELENYATSLENATDLASVKLEELTKDIAT